MSAFISNTITEQDLDERKVFFLPVIDMYKNMSEFRDVLDKVSYIMQYFENKNIKYEYKEKFITNDSKLFIIVKK